MVLSLVIMNVVLPTQRMVCDDDGHDFLQAEEVKWWDLPSP
jgi:hypothetical protein